MNANRHEISFGGDKSVLKYDQTILKLYDFMNITKTNEVYTLMAKLHDM